ncbi:hypothetical protein K488DRAFT_40313 [Vararia minispora EC-137]|uniref:Uncharacterized protein n=1 Tax=Vararia minispora EC-137 TaxID=1314806 RepID=A0ACB8QYJ2_9AGAM|nr:hypothetical protein K488DRAFT_40313 [Vararia minispora EC-137]
MLRPASHSTATPMAGGDSMRHWSFTAFEWIVRDVHKLRDYIETGEMPPSSDGSESTSPEHEDFEVLREFPTLGEGKFKLEIARTQSTSEVEHRPSTRSEPPTLSLYITCLTLDYPNAEYEICASMMAAIKCQDDVFGERGARAEWAWDTWQSEWVFRQGSEVWQCPLPSLSLLLDNPRIHQSDSFVICIQIHTPVGPFYPQHPTAYYVPRDLLEGLEVSLDNANTGDVRFICLERMNSQQQTPVPQSPTPTHSAASPSRRSSSESSPHPSFPSHTTVRKRIIYAHSDILTRRSDYFATMLSSTFAETAPSGDRKIYTIVVEEADFVTIYWLLKWVYANWLMFSEEDDPRAAVEGLGAGWSAKWLSSPGMPGEWDWKTLNKSHPLDDARDDVRSATSGESVRSTVDGARAPDQTKQDSTTATRHRAAPSQTTKQTSPPSRPGGPSAPRRVSGPGTLNTSGHVAPAHSKPVPIPGSHYPLSPRAPRAPAPTSADPHAHPTPQPTSASALSVYQVAHRYGMPGLASLALEHIMSTITPSSSFALLLASMVWEELHMLVEDYIVDKWDEVSCSEEFERCCQEVAAGDWGIDGGRTLMVLFRRLKSPS